MHDLIIVSLLNGVGVGFLDQPPLYLECNSQCPSNWKDLHSKKPLELMGHETHRIHVRNIKESNFRDKKLYIKTINWVYKNINNIER